MKKAAFAALLLVLVPLQAAAFDNEELLGLVAMPLAVAAASNITGVPAGDLSHLVTTLNQAAVPPTQVVQVIRYAPAALVVRDQQPTFVQYVDQQYDRGIAGPQLVTLIEDRYRTYDLEPQFVTLREPATTYVLRDDYIPPAVVTRVSQFQPAYQPYPSYPAYRVGDTNDLLSLIAMPLAVAAVSNLSGIPLQDLSGLVTSLNAARMPPLQVVEVLRYAPVALVSDYGQPQFVPYVRTQVVSGVRGPALISLIDQRLRTYDIVPQFRVVRREPDVRYVYDDYFRDDDYNDDYFPPVVRTRVAEVRTHPHGGPPGQLKKELGLQTGAEVVHGTRPGQFANERESVRRDRPAVERRSDRVVERVVPRERSVKSTRQAKAKPQRREISSRPAKRDREWKKPDRRKADRPRVEKQRTPPSRAERVNVKKSSSPRPNRLRSGGAGSHPHGKSEAAKGKGKGKGKG